ncbi:MAG: glycosyl hydrolase family 28-related protein [Kiritimatiellia bacterium]|nr:glycosyl hydrolase family 28-related protein [Kiritimatiellia bacterium]
MKRRKDSVGRCIATVGMLVTLWIPSEAAGPANRNLSREEFFTPERIALIQRRQAARGMEMTPDDIRSLVPYLYPSIEEPLPDAIRLDVPPEPGNRSLAEMGLLDVTASPFFADPTGEKDSTRALQAAADFARDHQMVCFLPAGTYRISDTLELRQNLYVRGNGSIQGAPQHPNVLMGSTADPQRRAVLLLAPRSEGFGDPDHRKLVVHFTNRTPGGRRPGQKTGTDPDFPQANTSYNQIFANIDIVIGEGNPGAVGIRMQAAEGSSIQDCTIDATHGLGGMQGAAGSGGSHHHITVIGGRFGIDTSGFPPEFRLDGPGTQPTPTLTHVTLLNQTGPALINRSRGPLVGVGWRIVGRGPGPLIQNLNRQASAPFDGSLCLVDSLIEFETSSPENRVLETVRDVLFDHVYVRNAALLLADVPVPSEGEWVHVRTLAVPVRPAKFNGLEVTTDPYLDGLRIAGPILEIGPATPPPVTLRSRHIWGSDFPSWESPGAANVRALGAAGDGITDDTAVIQKAIDEHDLVFLPKGVYRISDTLRLRSRTRLIGLAQHLSILMASPPFGPIHHPADPRPLIATADDADAETILAFLGLYVTYHGPADTQEIRNGHTALLWRAGPKSILRTVQITPWRLIGFPAVPRTDLQSLALSAPLVRIAGQGGGKWYNFFVHGNHGQPAEYRHLLVDGAKGPLAFYHLHAQHSPADAQCEIRDSTDVTVYGVKTEGVKTFLRVWRSNHIRIYGHGGIGAPVDPFQPGWPAAQYVFEEVPHFLISNIGDQVSAERHDIPFHGMTVRNGIRNYHPLIELIPGAPLWAIPSLERPVLYRRGHPRAAPE